jgi:Ca-activated chloride channel family protein
MDKGGEKMQTHKLIGYLTVIMVAFALFASNTEAQAAQFTADLMISGPDENYNFKLYVKDHMYRLMKVAGPMKYPDYPTIVNRETGLTWGLNQDMHQYMEIKEPEKTMMMNPLVGWAMTRKGMSMAEGGTDTIDGYECQTFEYRDPGDKQVAAKLWVALKLDFPVKEVRYATNGNAVMELKNIYEGPVDPALFKIPAGYTKMVVPGGSAKAAVQSPRSTKPMMETLTVKKNQGKGRSLEPDRRIVITATGDNPDGMISKAGITVQDKDKTTIETASFTLENNQSRTWEIPPDKKPWTLSLNGEEGQIRFKVEQFAVEGSPKPTHAATPPKAAKTSAGAPAGNLVFILDASGSMWGQVEGKAKIVIAKEVLTGLIQDLPDDAVVGLVAYGHRRKGDCNDVEELVPLGPIDKSKLIKIVQGLGAKGKTPISRSVRMTAERIKHLEDETTIILVSDGKETCDPDPCALVRELKEAGIRFVMHVIGFDVTEEERIQLECMAEAGGGEYFTAKTAKDFQMAATKAIKKAQEFGFLKMVAMKNNRPLHAWVEIYEAGTEKIFQRSTTSGETGTRNIKLPPGTYDILVQDSESVSGGEKLPVRFSDTMIELGQTVEKRADFSDGTLVIKAIKNGEPFAAKVFYYHQGEKESFFNETTYPKTGEARRKFVPGTYDVKVEDYDTIGKPAITISGIEVPPGSTVEKMAQFANGILKILTTRNGEPFSCNVRIFNPEGKLISDFWTQYGERTVQLLQGSYDLKLTIMSIPGGNPVIPIQGVVIEADRTEERTADFKIGFITVTTTLDGSPFNTMAKLYKEESGKQIANFATEGSRTVELTPGPYRLRVTNDKDKNQFKDFEGIKVEAGKTVNINVAFPIAHQETKTAPESKPEAAAALAPAPAKPSAQADVAAGPQAVPPEGKTDVLWDEVPVYPGAAVLKTQENGPIKAAKLEAQATITDILEFYKKVLPERGWQPGMAMAQGGKASAMFSKGNSKIVMSGREQEGKSRFDINLVKQ